MLKLQHSRSNLYQMLQSKDGSHVCLYHGIQWCIACVKYGSELRHSSPTVQCHTTEVNSNFIVTTETIWKKMKCQKLDISYTFDLPLPSIDEAIIIKILSVGVGRQVKHQMIHTPFAQT